MNDDCTICQDEKEWAGSPPGEIFEDDGTEKEGQGEEASIFSEGHYPKDLGKDRYEKATCDVNPDEDCNGSAPILSATIAAIASALITAAF